MRVLFLLQLGTVLLASLCGASIMSTKKCGAIKDRVDCSSGVGNPAGVQPLTREECTDRGCCYDATGNSSCFYTAEGRTVTKIHMINSNHFDAGYADITANVVNEYFTTYFPRAAAVGAALRRNGSEPLQWMTFSYLISLYFDCPGGMGLQCPDSAAKDAVTQAIKAKDIVWPAFPHNAEATHHHPSHPLDVPHHTGRQLDQAR